MEALSLTEKRRNIAELALLGYTDREIACLFNVSAWTIARDYASELADGRVGFVKRVTQFRQESAWCDEREAIYWEKYLIRHVRVSHCRVTTEYVRGRINVIPFGIEKDDAWFAGCPWAYFCGQRLLWLSTAPQGGRWKIFFSGEVISEVVRIRASFPSTDTFEPYDSHYFTLVQPLKKFMAQAASEHLRCLIERVNEIEVLKEISPIFKGALRDVERFLGNDKTRFRLLDFLFETERESGKSLTKTEADDLILGAYLVSGALGGSL